MPPRSVHPDARDPYGDLLRDTRGLRREQSQARESWLSRLPIDHKDEILFELESSSRAWACFANPRNHPGPARRIRSGADFREPLVFAKDAMSRIVWLSRSLSSIASGVRLLAVPRDGAADDGARTRLVHETLAQDTPRSRSSCCVTRCRTSTR